MKPFDFNMPHLIVMIGIPGSGKSFFANNFAKTFNAPLISYENIKNHLETLENSQSKALDESINNLMQEFLIETSKTKRTIIFDGHLHTRTACDNLAKTAKRFNYEPLFVWVQTDIETSKRRVMKKNAHTNHIDSDGFNRIVDKFNPIDRTKKNLIVISGKHTYNSQLKKVLSYLSKPKK
jgi:predicted kinase